MSETGKERWTGPAKIAWCDEHGLHGYRNTCFECGKPVEQIPMLPVSEHEAALAKARKQGREEVREAVLSDETRDRLRELLKEDGWTYLTPNSVQNLFDLLVRAAALDSLTKEGDCGA